jgi:hypothetical protein
MRYLIFVFVILIGCNTKQEKINYKIDTAYQNLVDKSIKNQIYFKSVDIKATAKQNKLVTQAITKIITLKEEVKDLKTELSETKIKVDTIIIHDTVKVVEKKSFWGKTKVDTTNNK